MKRVLSAILLCAVIGCCLFSLLSCSVKFGPRKTTVKSTTFAVTDPTGTLPASPADTATDTGEAGESTTATPEATTAPTTTDPDAEEELPIGEDPDPDKFGKIIFW